MNTTTSQAIQIAERLGRRGFTVARFEVCTPDGRTWTVDANSSGGFRLFEIDPEARRTPEEHDAVESDAWEASELIDYLDAVGRPPVQPPAQPPFH